MLAAKVQRNSAGLQTQDDFTFQISRSLEKDTLCSKPTIVNVPEIKLIRTDTTLDLSQKAEKV